MRFSLNDQHVSDFHSLGYTIFRAVLPPSLIRDLRQVCERGAALVRAKNGGNSQRFQPVAKFDLDQKPFEVYRDLPELKEAFATLLSPRHYHGDLNVLGVLIEPTERPWCTNWHRDLVHHDLDLTMATIPFYDLNLFNQINCALYEDSSTWYVPGSHLRPELPGEIAAMGGTIPAPGPNLENLNAEEAEARCNAYCHQMPGAIQMHLNAGDLAVYRAIGWHAGNYATYRKRATLHDAVETPEYKAYRDGVYAAASKRKAAQALAAASR